MVLRYGMYAATGFLFVSITLSVYQIYRQKCISVCVLDGFEQFTKGYLCINFNKP